MRIVGNNWARGVLTFTLILTLCLLPFAAGAKTITDEIKLITKGPAGLGGDSTAMRPSLSADGTKIAFESSATNLIPGITTTNGGNIYLYDTVSETMTLVTATTSGIGTNGWCTWPTISADGTKITYESSAIDLLSSGVTTNGNTNIFLYDVASDITTIVSAGPSGQGGNGGSQRATLSANGARITFYSNATNLIEGTTTSSSSNIFLYEPATSTTTLVTKTTSGTGIVGSGAHYPTISADGAKIVFASSATNLITGFPTNSSNNIFYYDIASDTTTLVTKGLSGIGGNAFSERATISADGKMVALQSGASDLVTGITTTTSGNIFYYDVVNDRMGLASKGPLGIGVDGWSSRSEISPDGTKVVFRSGASDVLPDVTTAQWIDKIYCYDITTDTIELITKGPLGLGPNNYSGRPSISADNNKIAFHSSATDLIPDFTPSGGTQVYLWTRTITLDVTFDPQNGIDQPFVEQVLQGQAIGQPATPTAPEGKVFAGWWTEAEGGTPWNFGSPVADNMTLFAHWDTPQVDTVEIFYGATDGGSVTVEEETIPATGTPVGSTAIADADHVFIGWIGTTFASEEELDAWIEWIESLENPFDALISTDAHFIPPAGENGLWSDAGYIAIFLSSDDERVPGPGPETPATGDSATLWSVAAIVLLGCVIVSAALYRKRFEQ